MSTIKNNQNISKVDNKLYVSKLMLLAIVSINENEFKYKFNTIECCKCNKLTFKKTTIYNDNIFCNKCVLKYLV